MTGMHWAKWWTALLAAALLSLTIVAARAGAQELPHDVPDSRTSWDRVFAIDLCLVAVEPTADGPRGPFHAFSRQPGAEARARRGPERQCCRGHECPACLSFQELGDGAGAFGCCRGHECPACLRQHRRRRVEAGER